MENKKSLKGWLSADVLEAVLTAAMILGSVSAAAVVAFLGKVVFAGVLLLIAFGVFLRFKRRKSK